MIPYYDTRELHLSYLNASAIDAKYLTLNDRICFRPGITKFIFPAGVYKPVQQADGYTYYLSPYGTLVVPIGQPYFVEGGIKVNLSNGKLLFMSFMGALPVGEQNLRDYEKQMQISEIE